MGKCANWDKCRMRWVFIWLIQFVAALFVSLLTALSLLFGSTIHWIFLWILAPLLGFCSAMISTRKGLLNYAAWIAPPAMLLVGNLLLWGYPLSAGPVFFCSFISLVGAATGEVLKRQSRR